MTRERIADQLAKRARDGVDRRAGFLARRAAEAAAEAEAKRIASAPIRRLPPAVRAAMLLNLDRVTRLGSYDKLSSLGRIERGRVIEEILGRPVPVNEHAKLDERLRHVGWRLTLGNFKDGPGGFEEDALWTVRDGADRVITAWVYRKTWTLSARVRGPKRSRRTKPAGWALDVAELLLAAAGIVTRCGACGRWFGRLHARQRFCDDRCSTRARQRRWRAARRNGKA